MYIHNNLQNAYSQPREITSTYPAYLWLHIHYNIQRSSTQTYCYTTLLQYQLNTTQWSKMFSLNSESEQINAQLKCTTQFYMPYRHNLHAWLHVLVECSAGFEARLEECSIAISRSTRSPYVCAWRPPKQSAYLCSSAPSEWWQVVDMRVHDGPLYIMTVTVDMSLFSRTVHTSTKLYLYFFPGGQNNARIFSTSVIGCLHRLRGILLFFWVESALWSPCHTDLATRYRTPVTSYLQKVFIILLKSHD